MRFFRAALILVSLVALAATGCQLDVMLRRLPPESPIVVNISPVDEGPAGQGSPVSMDVLVGGAQTYDERCSPCHGSTGEGNGPLAEVLPIRPRNYRKDEFKWGTRPSEIVATIRGGRSNVMPPFEGELTAREMWAVSYVVWSWIPEDQRAFDTQADLQDR